jgi:hypothetical protein
MTYYSKQAIWKLFLLCAFPLHVWTLLLSFRDFSWLSERTNLWDALGVASYGLIFAFFESAFILIIALFFGFLVSPLWNPEKRITLLGMLALTLSIWSILSQAYFVFGWSLPQAFIDLLIYTNRPVLYTYIVLSIFVVPSFLLPTYFILFSESAFSTIAEFFERLSFLMMVYLGLEVLALIVIVIRNI